VRISGAGIVVYGRHEYCLKTARWIVNLRRKAKSSIIWQFSCPRTTRLLNIF